MFLFFAGLILDAVFLFGPDRKAVFSKGPLIKTGWGPWDVCRVVILFSFFAYVLIIIESGIVSLMPSLENKKYLIMMLNSTVMDFLAIAIVLRIALVEYKERLRSLGLSMANFIKHIGIGIIGYITALPVIIGALVFTMWITKLLKYTPPMEPVVKLFLEEKSLLLLMYSAVFAIVFGPICEEIFFRGFMYPALKKRMGALMSIICTAFLFSVLHTNAVGFLPIMVLGVLLAYLYEKTGSLVPSIGVHVIHNAGMMLLVFLTKGLRA